MNNIDLYYSFQVRNQDGTLALDSGRREGHSFTKQFAQLMFNSRMFGLARFTPESVTDITGASITAFRNMIDGFSAIAATGVSNRGLQVGSGTTAESIDDYVLATQIAHGTSAGQLQYGTATFGAPSTDSTSTTIRFTRVFTNGSGNTVTVKEIGLVGRHLFPIPEASYLLIRDLTGDIDVLDGQQLTVNYDLVTEV
jgi:hypothetical protein